MMAIIIPWAVGVGIIFVGLIAIVAVVMLLTWIVDHGDEIMPYIMLVLIIGLIGYFFTYEAYDIGKKFLHGH